MTKLNGFNNGRDASDGIGGQPGPFDQPFKKADNTLHLTVRAYITTNDIEKYKIRKDLGYLEDSHDPDRWSYECRRRRGFQHG